MTLLDRANDVRAWLAEVRAWSALDVTPLPLRDCDRWAYSDGQLVHDTGRFFSVAGLRANGSDHAMIDQPEVGWLGFIIRPGPAGPEWLVQAKTEPGNVHDTQIAPSLQATRSNYECLHGGAPTRFLARFQHARAFVSDGPHSEQGTRFLWKFNRNSVLALPSDQARDVSGGPQWTWCAAPALREMLAQDYAVNTDARSVIATAPWALLCGNGPLFDAPVLTASYRRLARDVIKSQADQMVARARPVGARPENRWSNVPLQDLSGYEMTPTHLIGPDGAPCVGFYGINVEGREVAHWCQPLLLAPDTLEVTLLMRVTDAGAEVFVRPYQEVGFGARREYGPSMHGAFDLPEQMQGWIASSAPQTLLRVEQSDEGGRFMQVKASYAIAVIKDVPPRMQYPFGSWIPLGLLEELVARPGASTNELRTLASIVLSTDFDRACRDL